VGRRRAGLLGSTEFAEAHYDELRANGVAYINSDSSGRGYLGVQGSHTLEKFSNDIMREVSDPETKLSAWKRAQLKEIADAKTPEKRKEIRERADLRIGPLGSGSDYTAFLDHDGVASLISVFGGEDGAESIIRSTTIFTGTPIQRYRICLRPRARANRRHRRDAHGDADLLPFEFAISPIPCRCM